MGNKSIRSSLRAVVVAAFAVVTATTLGSQQAVAAPICAGAGQAPVLVGSIPGAALEGLTVDAQGRAYTTDLLTGRIYRIDRPGAGAVVVATVPGGNSAGALAWAPDGTLLVGYSGPAVLIGDSTRPGTVARVDVATGAVAPIASGLSAANGMDVGSDGIIYATNDFGQLIGRVYPNGVVQPDWSRVQGANGAVLSSGDAYLYVSRTFANPGISRVPTANPGAPESIVDFGGGDFATTADGLTLDSRDRPIVPANLTGQILRVDGRNQFCVLASGLPMSSVLSYGRSGTGFADGRLFRAGFDGNIYEIPGGFDPAARTATP